MDEEAREMGEDDLPDVQTMDIGEFLEGGFLQEANRQFFHPLGLALEVAQVDGEWRLSRIWDYRDDVEGMIFAPGELNADKARHVHAERMKHYDHRSALFSNPHAERTDVQPINWDPGS